MEILIYGGGAVGLGIASCLLKSQQEVDILARSDTCAALKTQGLFRNGIFGECHFLPNQFECFTNLNEITKSKKYDYILVCVKSYDSFSSARDLYHHKQLFKDETKIVLFQNGWGNAEIFAEFFPRDKIYNARVITGFVRKQKYRVTITVHAEPIHIGSIFDVDCLCLQDLAIAINNGDVPCEVYPPIAEDLWAKMLYNCALNPLGAILNVPYGKLGEQKWTRDIMDNVVAEVYQVMSKLGYRTHWPSPQEYLKVFYTRLLPATADHESSTLQDIRSGKKTEIDFLNGAVVKLAGEVGISVPYNSTLYALLKFLENKNRADKGSDNIKLANG